MSDRPTYACRECGTRVSSSSYRSTCPDCDGPLKAVTAAGI